MVSQVSVSSAVIPDQFSRILDPNAVLDPTLIETNCYLNTTDSSQSEDYKPEEASNNVRGSLCRSFAEGFPVQTRIIFRNFLDKTTHLASYCISQGKQVIAAKRVMAKKVSKFSSGEVMHYRSPLAILDFLTFSIPNDPKSYLAISSSVPISNRKNDFCRWSELRFGHGFLKIESERLLNNDIGTYVFEESLCNTRCSAKKKFVQVIIIRLWNIKILAIVTGLGQFGKILASYAGLRLINLSVKSLQKKGNLCDSSLFTKQSLPSFIPRESTLSGIKSPKFKITDFFRRFSFKKDMRHANKLPGKFPLGFHEQEDFEPTRSSSEERDASPLNNESFDPCFFEKFKFPKICLTEASLDQCISSTFLTLSDNIKEYYARQCRLSGVTAGLLITQISSGLIAAANVGDVEFYLGEELFENPFDLSEKPMYRFRAVALSRLHTLENDSEITRFLISGCSVRKKNSTHDPSYAFNCPKQKYNSVSLEDHPYSSTSQVLQRRMLKCHEDEYFIVTPIGQDFYATRALGFSSIFNYGLCSEPDMSIVRLPENVKKGFIVGATSNFWKVFVDPQVVIDLVVQELYVKRVAPNTIANTLFEIFSSKWILTYHTIPGSTGICIVPNS